VNFSGYGAAILEFATASQGDEYGGLVDKATAGPVFRAEAGDAD